MDDIRNFRGRGKSLRYNWDDPKFWHTQGRIDTAERYGMELSVDELEKIAKEYDRVGYNSQTKTYDGLGKDLRLANKKLSEIDNKTTDPLCEFELAELPPKVGARRLMDDEISYNVKNKGWRLTFNQKTSKSIKAHGGYEYATIGRNKKGDVMLMLNDANGVPMQNSMKENATIGSKVLCEKLAEYLNINEQYVVLKIKEIAKTNDYVAYLVTK